MPFASVRLDVDAMNAFVTSRPQRLTMTSTKEASDDGGSTSDSSVSTTRPAPTTSAAKPDADNAAPTSTDTPTATETAAETATASAAPEDTPVTPTQKASAGQTPKSAPAATGSVGARQRRLSQPARVQPTLLTDFLLGRQSQARVAASRRKTLDAAAVKAELRTAMRQSSVRRIQQPGGVRDRVKNWQKKTAVALVEGGNPEIDPSEPTEIAFKEEERSVTESDRVRIKARKKEKQPRAPDDKKIAPEEDDEDDWDDDPEDAAKPIEPLQPPKARPGPRGRPKVTSPPKRRIVSDDNWMKRKKRTSPSPKFTGARTKPDLGRPVPIPKDFLQRTAQNPTVKNKIKDWATRVEIPETPPAKYTRNKERRVSREKSNRQSSQDTARPSSSRSAPEDGFRARPVRSTRSAEVRQAQIEREARRRSGPKKIVVDDGIRVRPLKPSSPDDGIKVRPLKPSSPDDGIRVRPLKTSLPNDGIRVRPLELRNKGPAPRTPSVKTSSPSQSVAPTESTYTARSAPARSTRLGGSSTDSLHRFEKKKNSTPEKGTKLRESRSYEDQSRRVDENKRPGSQTPTRIPHPKRSPSIRKAQPKSKPRRSPSPAETRTETATTLTESWQDHEESVNSQSPSNVSLGELSEPSTLPSKTLADIPVGLSAFSELDLPVRGEGGRSRPSNARGTSFKGVPQVLKKVVSEGKKMIHEVYEKPEPPRAAPNRPVRIENWLENTVDPFVDALPAPKVSPIQKQQSVEDEWKMDARKRSIPEPRTRSRERSPSMPNNILRDNGDHGRTSSTKMKDMEKKAPAPVPKKERVVEEPMMTAAIPAAATLDARSSSPGLRRSRATRGSASSVRATSAKKPTRDLRRDTLRGESGGHAAPSSNGSRGSSSRGRDHDAESDRYRDDRSSDSYSTYKSGSERRDHHRKISAGSGKSSALLSSSSADASSIAESELSSSYLGSDMHYSDYVRRPPPPTHGDHELSTILSEESSGSRPSDTMSTISESTVTQTTVTKMAGDFSIAGSQRSSTGLKRRLTKHSDLVSVLSLPDDARRLSRAKSIKRARSLHRRTSKLDNATLSDLLLEFGEDDDLYSRELKTLVDGVIPVLLTQFVHERDPQRSAQIFGAGADAHRINMMSKAVVDMGVVLEELRTLHKLVPLHDAQRMIQWMETAFSVYEDYLDAWRLGFQGIIVNLAPAAGRQDDNDSLLNAMDRNEDGDVLDVNGERVDVAYLLKRPLLRIRWMLKFAKGVKIILGAGLAGDIVTQLEALHEKARRRHREETARKTDEDAIATDTTRARSLRNLAALDHVHIDRGRQVNAKDWFDLDLSHSNGQRLECQVELIFRDVPGDPSDAGDILIREAGADGQSWLLFPPISLPCISARRGEDEQSLVVMIRDVYHGHEWYELMTLYADLDDAVDDWLEIMGTSPVPPMLSDMSVAEEMPRAAEEADIPLGERRFQEAGHESPTGPKTLSRYHSRQSSSSRTPSTPPSPSSPRSVSDAEKTPTQSSARLASPPQSQGRRALPVIPEKPTSHPLNEDMRPDPSKLKSSSSKRTIADEDGAPPLPPAHRSVGPKAAPILAPPSSKKSQAPWMRRRTSSPLKHEYHPSDHSSESDSTSEGSETESESSIEDDLYEDDIPDTLPGISIKQAEPFSAEAMASEREDSIAPSHSASQIGLPGLRTSRVSEHTLQFTAEISYWSNKKGAWKGLKDPVSTIVITPGLIEAFAPGAMVADARRSPGRTESSEVEISAEVPRPLIALDLTPLVMIRQSTLIDLEIRSPVRAYAKYSNLDTSIFRFRASSPAELANLYKAVHQSRMNNAKYKALEEEARFESFGQPQERVAGGDDNSSMRRRGGWFGRKNSYRASTRAPSQVQSQSQSQGSSSTLSATSFLRRLTGHVNKSFNIDRSSVDKSGRPGSGGMSFYTSSGASSAGSGIHTMPRSPSVSLADGSIRGVQALGTTNIKMRCHLQISGQKWEDRGNCTLTIARPPPGARQELTIYHGLEKRVLVLSIPRKENIQPLIVLDVVVGSACFTRLAARGIVLNVWEEMRDEQNRVGHVSAAGAISGRVRKWCFQFSTAAVASWVYGLVASEVEIA
ncbi:hypothetical protein CMQ_6074 [Grosmannia clavigera kw1407]|uniref:Glucan 4-alpha-glucosidase n=1 Tax=Grosmannia clavigera (strain kw1407 / UAMH 11150) TaxID=655863 RepID=F0XME2_GROCL|nr:uncharacterized protein CMQ_6074 [Grosmannia clavigera kw1407]EFX01132.1 hypothetical protein CMQ_6074 [Grosmannia clavigera kw1407]